MKKTYRIGRPPFCLPLRFYLLQGRSHTRTITSDPVPIRPNILQGHIRSQILRLPYAPEKSRILDIGKHHFPADALDAQDRWQLKRARLSYTEGYRQRTIQARYHCRPTYLALPRSRSPSADTSPIPSWAFFSSYLWEIPTHTLACSRFHPHKRHLFLPAAVYPQLCRRFLFPKTARRYLNSHGQDPKRGRSGLMRKEPGWTEGEWRP